MFGMISRAGVANLTALVCIQASNALIPLMIVPFVLSEIGVHSYAELAIAESISMIVLATVLFSFEVDGVARVAGFRMTEHLIELGDALSEIVAARLILFVVASAVVLAGYGLVTGHEPVLLALYLLVPLGQVFHSYWFYQGTETNLAPAIITLISRLVTLVIVFVGVRGPADQMLVPLAIGAPFAIGGLVSLLYLAIGKGLHLRWVGFASIFRVIRHGKEIFVGNAAVILYRDMNVVLLGIAGTAASGIAVYSLVEKTVKMIQACTRPLNQFFFPKVLRSIAQEHTPTKAVARIVLRFTAPQVAVTAGILAAIPLTYAVVSPHWPWLAQFARLPYVVELLAIMAPATLFGLANFMFGSAALNYLGERAYLLRSILATGVISALACLVFAPRFGATAAGICFVGSEILLFLFVLLRYLRETDAATTSSKTIAL